jgi:hypothetical protein
VSRNPRLSINFPGQKKYTILRSLSDIVDSTDNIQEASSILRYCSMKNNPQIIECFDNFKIGDKLSIDKKNNSIMPGKDYEVTKIELIYDFNIEKINEKMINIYLSGKTNYRYVMSIVSHVDMNWKHIQEVFVDAF